MNSLRMDGPVLRNQCFVEGTEMTLPFLNCRHPVRAARIALQRGTSTSPTAPIYAICAQSGRLHVLSRWMTVPSRPQSRMGHARSEMPLTSLECQLRGGQGGTAVFQLRQ